MKVYKQGQLYFAEAPARKAANLLAEVRKEPGMKNHKYCYEWVKVLGPRKIVRMHKYITRSTPMESDK